MHLWARLAGKAGFRDGGRSEDMDGKNLLPPLVEVGLIDMKKILDSSVLSLELKF